MRVAFVVALAVLAAGCGGGGEPYDASATASCVAHMPAPAGGLRVSPTAPALTVLHLGGAPVQAQRVTLSFLRPDFDSTSGASSADLYFLPDSRSATLLRDRWYRHLPASTAGRSVQQRRNAVVVWSSVHGDGLLRLTLGCLRAA